MNQVEFEGGIEELRAIVVQGYQRLGSVERQIDAMAVCDRYPAVPTESWQDRGGDSRYLYMLFQQGDDYRYGGPGGKRKVYVGNKIGRIAKARRLAANSRQYSTLCRRRRYLRALLREQGVKLHCWLSTVLAEPLLCGGE
jgi:hypothetical protein